MILALTLPLMAWPADMPAGPKIWQIVTWAILVALLTLGLHPLHACEDRWTMGLALGKVGLTRTERASSRDNPAAEVTE